MQRTIDHTSPRRSLPKKVLLLFLTLAGSAFLSVPRQTGNEAPGLRVPEGFTIESAVAPDLISYPMFATFDEKGRLFVFESTGTNDMGTENMLKNPSYHIRILEDTDGDGRFEKSYIFADKIALPMGGTFYKGSLYVAESPNLVRYTDTDGDGKADKKDVLLTGWVLHANAATLHGPFLGPDGWLYLPDARRSFDITTREGKRLKGKGARIWRCKPDGSRLEPMSGGGFDNAIEIAFMPSGETIGTMTYFVDPQGGFRDALMHWVEGGVYPKPNPVIQEDNLKLTGPLMPVMSKTARVAPSGLMRYKGNGFGPAYRDDLFSAEFNTGRIMRHKVKAEGATYTTTVDEPFMTSAAADSHPTDVLQDADGSLLVVVTGGWFIEGCPLSRVAKPDVRGGIYRIRKNGAPRVTDPRGLKLNLEAMEAARLASLQTDPRPAVRERMLEELVRRGNAALPVLRKFVTTATDTEFAAAALFAASRIETPEALALVRTQLGHRHAVLRTAAARAAGLAKDALATGKLQQLVAADVAPVRRQAAVALEQIGDPAAIPALLKAAAQPGDRFVEHAVTHALIMLNQAPPLVQALSHTSPKVRKTALVALDQMDASPLTKTQVAAFLKDKDPSLQDAGIWVATHHPEWTDIVVEFLSGRLQKNTFTPEEAASLRNLMLTFCKNEPLQQFISAQLENKALSAAKKSLLLSVMGNCEVRTFPETWATRLGNLLHSGDTGVQQDALGIIQSRRIGSLTGELETLIRNSNAEPLLRMKALNAKILSNPGLTDKDFAMLSGFLAPEYDSPVRQTAARLLVQATPTTRQLVEIATAHIPRSDAFLLPGLVESFAGTNEKEAGDALVKALKGVPDRLGNLSEPDLKRILKGFPSTVQESAAPIIRELQARHAEMQNRIATLDKELPQGDVSEGRKLFFGKASCSACHAVGSDGGNFGPDLTNIGDIRSRQDMLEAILYPSVSFAREHESFRVVTSATTYVGILKEQTPEYVTLAPGPGPGIRIPRNEIKAIEPHNISMMPPGLDQLMNPREMADLMAFMEALPDGIKPLKASK